MGCLLRAHIVCSMDDTSLNLSKKSVDSPPPFLCVCVLRGRGGGGRYTVSKHGA